MKSITLLQFKKLQSELCYLKDTATSNELLLSTWIDGLSIKSKSVFNTIKDLANDKYNSVSLAIDIINNKLIKY